MDDTIFDHSLTCRAALGELRRSGKTLQGRTLDELWHEYVRLLGATHTDVMLGRRTAEDVRTDRFALLAAWCGPSIERDRARELSRQYRANYQRLRRPVAGAPEFVRRLHGRTKIGIVTNNTIVEQEEKLVFLRLDRFVDFLVTSEEVGSAKPEPAIFRTALERAGAVAAEAVMVGDAWESDVLGARRSGVPAVWFNRFHGTQADGASVAEFSSFRPAVGLERLLAHSASSR
jgi:HAD superfamily hydrolase (TIGR01549 family)